MDSIAPDKHVPIRRGSPAIWLALAALGFGCHGGAADPSDAGADESATIDASADRADAAAELGDASSGEAIEDPSHSSAVSVADPDTVIARDGSYITYGTTIPAGAGPRCGAEGELFVPYLEHGSGSAVGMSDCAAGDAMPGGPGAWAEGAIWAPGVARYGDQYIMYYMASRQGTGQKCIGRATAESARGPFASLGEWACPPEGRWAIDANPIVVGEHLYVAYRDDAITSFPETGLSVVRTDAQGAALWDTRRDLLRSTDIGWDSIDKTDSTNVVENPSLFEWGGVWHVAYSANNWDSHRYATGIARCGESILPEQPCTPLEDGATRPYFGYIGEEGLDPYRGLPENHPGPGGMDMFHAADGTLRAVWHWWNPGAGTRHAVVGRLLHDDGGFLIGP